MNNGLKLATATATVAVWTALILAVAADPSSNPGRRGVNEKPVPPGPGVGCLTSPSCGPKLRTGQRDEYMLAPAMPVTPKAPNDPKPGTGCLNDPKCRRTLEIKNPRE